MSMIYVHPASTTAGIPVPRVATTVAQLRIVTQRTRCYCGRPVSVVRTPVAPIYCDAHR